MSDTHKLIKARIGLLQLAQELGNIKAHKGRRNNRPHSAA